MLNKALFTHLKAATAGDGVQRLVVGAVIGRDDLILLLRRPADDFMGGIWELPSGTVEAGESLDAALLREVAEETGLTVTGISAYLGSFDYASSSGKPTRQFNFTVAVAVARTSPVALSEHDAYLWATPADRLPVTDAVKDVLDTYHAAT